MRKHLVKILLCLFIAVCVLLGVFGYHELTSGNLSINLHDTYYVTEVWPVFLIIFIILGFTSYLSSELVSRFNDRSSNLVLLSFTLLLALVVFAYNRHTGQFFDDRGGWVVYPPLSTMEEGFEEAMMSRFRFWRNLVWAGKAILIGLSVFLIYRSFYWGKFKKPDKPKSPLLNL